MLTAAGHLLCIFFLETKIPISTARYWHRSTGRMANSPPLPPPRCQIEPPRSGDALFATCSFFLPPLDHSITDRMLEQLTGASSYFTPVLPPLINQMPPVDNWEQKILSNLAGSVQINPGDHRLLACSFDWLCRRPREGELEYKSCIHDNWPNFVGEA